MCQNSAILVGKTITRGEQVPHGFKIYFSDGTNLTFMASEKTTDQASGRTYYSVLYEDLEKKTCLINR